MARTGVASRCPGDTADPWLLPQLCQRTSAEGEEPAGSGAPERAVLDCLAVLSALLRAFARAALSRGQADALPHTTAGAQEAALGAEEAGSLPAALGDRGLPEGSTLLSPVICRWPALCGDGAPALWGAVAGHERAAETTETGRRRRAPRAAQPIQLGAETAQSWCPGGGHSRGHPRPCRVSWHSEPGATETRLLAAPGREGAGLAEGP